MLFFTIKGKNYIIKKYNNRSFKSFNDLHGLKMFFQIVLNNCGDKNKIKTLSPYFKALRGPFSNVYGYQDRNIRKNLYKTFIVFLINDYCFKNIKLNNTNTKLGKKTVTINFNEWLTCNNRINGNCPYSSVCYDLKASCQHTYAVVLNALKNKYLLLKDPKGLLDRFIYLLNGTKKGKTIKTVRFNARGDFNDLNELIFSLSLSNALSGSKKCYCYTKSFRLVNDYYVNHKKDFKYLVFNESVKNGLNFKSNTYLVTTDKKKVTCQCNCTECNKCKVLSAKTNYVFLH